jgi:hypothetical protein
VKLDSLGPSLDVVHLADKLGPVILVDHGSHEFLFIVCSSPALSAPLKAIQIENLLMVHDSIDVGDDTVI